MIASLSAPRSRLTPTHEGAQPWMAGVEHLRLVADTFPDWDSLMVGLNQSRLEREMVGRALPPGSPPPPARKRAGLNHPGTGLIGRFGGMVNPSAGLKSRVVGSNRGQALVFAYDRRSGPGSLSGGGGMGSGRRHESPPALHVPPFCHGMYPLHPQRVRCEFMTGPTISRREWTG